MFVNHLMQLMGGTLNVEVLILSRSAFRGNQTTPMNIFEIPVGELIPSLGVLAVLIVNAEIPFGVFIITMKTNELVLLLCCRTILAPVISIVEDVLAFVDECFRMFECSFIECYRHDF